MRIPPSAGPGIQTLSAGGPPGGSLRTGVQAHSAFGVATDGERGRAARRKLAQQPLERGALY
jgi:hypothetical protein